MYRTSSILLAALAALGSTLAAPTGSGTDDTSRLAKRATSVVSNCEVSGQIALTFDDGPYIYESTVANTFGGNNKATFFLNGANYGCIYDHADEIIALHNAGHTLGSHSWSHPDFTTLSYDDAVSQIARVEEAFIKILGLKPKYFRPPYGAYNDQLLQILSDRGYTKLVLWSDDVQDASDGGPNVGFSKGVIDGAAGSFPQPHLVLDHSTVQSTAQDLVPYAVDKLTSAGYKLVAIDTCLGSDGEWPYYYIGAPGQRDDSWHC